jgi:hypothetical protein
MKATDLADVIMDKGPIIRKTASTYFFEDGTRKNRIKYADEIFDLNNLMEMSPEAGMEFSSKSLDAKKKYRQRTMALLDQEISIIENMSHNNVDPAQLKGLDIVDTVFDFDQFILFKNMVKGKYQGEQIVFSLPDRQITDIDPEVYMDSMSREMRANFKPVQCVFKYDPYNIAPINKGRLHKQIINEVNIYIPPKWRVEDYKPTGEEKVPTIIGEFLSHLFPNIEVRLFVCAWLKNALLYRSETILVLNGAKGAGKGLFVELCRSLVGKENFGKAKDSLLTKDWNAVLEDKRLIFMDELKINKAAYNRLKDVVNEDHNIEKKGKDANNLTKTFNSFIVNNNDIPDVYVEHDDRRFSCVEITDKPLKDVYSPNQIKELVAVFTDDTIIREFGNWLIQYEHKVYKDPFYMWKGEKFHSLVFSSLYGWQQFIVEKLLDVDYVELPISVIRMDAEDSGHKFPSSTTKIGNFLQNYYHRGESRLGRLKKIKNVWKLYKYPVEKELDL